MHWETVKASTLDGQGKYEDAESWSNESKHNELLRFGEFMRAKTVGGWLVRA